MPRPHYPTTGGPHLPSWNMREARQRHRPQTVTPAAKEVAGVKAPPPAHPSTAGAGDKGPGTRNDRSANISPVLRSSSQQASVPFAMLWVAGFLSLAALLFTVLVLLHHG